MRPFHIAFFFSIFLSGLPGRLLAQEDGTTKDPPTGQQRCSDLRTGTFYYITDSGLFIIVERSKGEQIQHRVYQEAFMVESIEWLSDCTYKLTALEDHDPDHTKTIGSEMFVRITTITENYYDLEERQNGEWIPDNRMHRAESLEKALEIQKEHH